MKQENTLLRDFIIINIACGIAALMMFVAMILQRTHIIPSIPCALVFFFHIYCPGCGGTRALFSLLHGHILQSLYYNPAVLLGALLILYYEVAVIVTLVKNNGKIYYYRKATLVYIYLVIVFGYAIVRDILLFVPGIDMLGDVL
ncbi:MAG: DUF2752 domain-containing protein [Clostridiales bacterium]|nr:DUF2752 domain-containing protein [Clostridiales bacterium]